MGESRERETTFRFKQFEVSDRQSAMKIGTDGVLLGAWAPLGTGSLILDVGCGSGLISLMLAQRDSSAQIIGIEISRNAAKECAENFMRSRFGERLSVIYGDFTDMYATLPQPDMIVSNPPFFTNGERSGNTERANARHCDTLSFKDLIDLSARILSPKGSLCLISPADMRDEIEFQATLSGLSLNRLTKVVPCEGKPCKRLLWHFSRIPTRYNEDYLTIRDKAGYTEEYIKLTSDFYLNF